LEADLLTAKQERAVLAALREERLSRAQGADKPRSYSQLVPGVSARQVQHVVSRQPGYGLGRRRAAVLRIEQEAGELRAQGLSYKAIGDELGVTAMTAWRWAQKAGPPPPRRGPAV